MWYIISGITFAAKKLTLLYLGKLGGGTVLIHGLHPTLTEKPHRLTPVIGIDLPVKRFEGIRKGFPTRPVTRNVSPQTTRAKQPSASPMSVGTAPQRSTALLSKVLRGIISTSPAQKKPASHCIILPWMSPWTPIETKIEERGDHDDIKYAKWKMNEWWIFTFSWLNF